MSAGSLFVPYGIAAGVTLLNVWVTRGAEQTARRSIDDVLEHGRDVVADELPSGVDAEVLDGALEEDRLPWIVSWTSEVGSVFSGVVGLAVANVLAAMGSDYDDFVIGLAICSILLGVAVLARLAMTPPHNQLRKAIGPISAYTAAVIGLHLISGCVVAMAGG